MDIIKSELSIRSKNALMSGGIYSVESLMHAYNSGVDFKKLRNLGNKSLAEINAFCSNYSNKDQINASDIEKLSLNRSIHDFLLKSEIRNFKSLSKMSIEDIQKFSDLCTNDIIILTDIITSLNISVNGSIENSKHSSIEISERYEHEKASGNEIYNKIVSLFIDKSKSTKIENLINEYKILVINGQISELDFVYRLMLLYVKSKYDSLYGPLNADINSNKIRSNNQSILFFIQRKLFRKVNMLNISKDEVLLLLKTTQDLRDEWILKRVIGMFDYSFINILNQYYVVNKSDYSMYLEVVRRIESFPKKKYESFVMSAKIFNDVEFLTILQSSYQIGMDESGKVWNLVSEIPLVERIYKILDGYNKPLLIDDLWRLTSVSDSSKMSIRNKLIRDNRFILYGKLGYVGLVRWNLVIDEVIGGTIPETTLLLLKKYNLKSVAFSTIAKLYTRLNKKLSLPSWKANLLASDYDLIIKNNSAFVNSHRYSVSDQEESLGLLFGKITALLNNEKFSSAEVMNIVLEIGLLDYSNYDILVKYRIDEIKSLIRSNVEKISLYIIGLEDIDSNFVENCMGIKLLKPKKIEYFDEILDDMFTDGAISHEEREIIANWVEEEKISLEKIRKIISKSLIEGDIDIDKQVAYIFQFRGVDSMSESDLIFDIEYLLFNVLNLDELSLMATSIKIVNGMAILNHANVELRRIELKVLNQEFIVTLNNSFWDNMTFEFSEKENKPMLNIFSSGNLYKYDLLEDGILTYLLSENILDPFNLSRVRKRIRYKIREEYQELFE